MLNLPIGRCGSTMISDVLNMHPDVLSLSEVSSLLGPLAHFRKQPSGRAMWALCSRRNPAPQMLLSDNPIRSEILYPIDDPRARYSTRYVPPILWAMLPHPTPEYESLYDGLKPIVRARPRATLGAHCRHLFKWLRERFDRCLWVERSGGSLLSVPRSRRFFPEARIIHIHCGGRDTALSMSRHPAFRIMLATLHRLRHMGLKPLDNTTRARLVCSILASLFLRLVNRRKMVRRTLDLEGYGGLWSRMILQVQKLLAPLPREQVLELRYEDVLQRPYEKHRESIAFINPSLSNDAWLHEAARIPRQSPHRYLSLDAETRQRLAEACGRGPQALG